MKTFKEWFAPVWGSYAYKVGYLVGAKAAWNYQQALIDELMLEYCPKEMSQAQVNEYKKHQRPAPVFADVAKTTAHDYADYK
jgi:hypothetical protein